LKTIKDLKQLVNFARKHGPAKVAVVAPYDKATINAVKEGLENGLIKSQLFGDKYLIEISVREAGIEKFNVDIQHGSDSTKLVQAAVQSVRYGKNDLLMKGKISTPNFMKPVLDKTIGLNAGRLCSHVVICEIPGFHRLLIITDGGLNIAPTLKEKVDIVKNAVDVAHALGIIRPKVAILAAIEEVNPSMPATIDAACLAKMGDRGAFGDAIVDGPLAFDNAISIEAAEKKDIKSEVAGRADILVVPYIEVGNVLGKSLSYIGKTLNAAIVVGAKKPIILPSRAGNQESKCASLALGVLLERRSIECIKL